MKEFWQGLTIQERMYLALNVYYAQIVKISGFKYLPTPNKIAYCDWDNIGPIYQDALMGCHS